MFIIFTFKGHAFTQDSYIDTDIKLKSADLPNFNIVLPKWDNTNNTFKIFYPENNGRELASKEYQFDLNTIIPIWKYDVNEDYLE